MNDLMALEYDGKAVRTVVTDEGDVCWVAKDVAEILGYSNTNDAISRHCKGVVIRYPLLTDGGEQEVRVIHEPDLFRLIANSRLDGAVKFEAWIFEEVLPSIRKHGHYSMGGAPRNLPDGKGDPLDCLAAICLATTALSGGELNVSRERLLKSCSTANMIVHELYGVDTLGLMCGLVNPKRRVEEVYLTTSELIARRFPAFDIPSFYQYMEDRRMIEYNKKRKRWTVTKNGSSIVRDVSGTLLWNDAYFLPLSERPAPIVHPSLAMLATESGLTKIE